MAAMHLELFALAFFRRFTNVIHAGQQSIFTRRYLYGKNKPYIWEAMGHYNLIISKTACWGMTENTAANRMAITFNNDMRSQMLETWGKNSKLDPKILTDQDKENFDCVIRVCNHFGADIMKNQELGNRQITASFLYRLGADEIFGNQWKPSADFLLRLASQPYSMYEFATQALKNVNLRFS